MNAPVASKSACAWYRGPSLWRQMRGSRRLLLVCGFLLAAWAWWQLDLYHSPFSITPGGWESLGKFCRAAFHPCIDYESPPVVEMPPLLTRAARAALDTMRYAGAAVTLSVMGGLILGFLGSSAWWDHPGASQNKCWRYLMRGIWLSTRAFMTFCRSIHELIWAILLLSAMGFTPIAAVLAIAIPYSGTLAKVFSEMTDEMPRDGMNALVAAGARPIQAWLFGLVPRALPDLFSYILYRFECGLRSATVLGFWGFGTLGLCIQQAFDNSDYREAWTYLYVMIAMILFFDWWSGAIRQRMTPPSSSGAGALEKDHTDLSIPALKRARTRDSFLRTSALAIAALSLVSLLGGLFIEIRWHQSSPSLFAVESAKWTMAPDEWQRRMANLHRFVVDLTPPPLLPQSQVTWHAWIGGIAHYALPAAWTTLWISIVSMVLASGAAALSLPLASRVMSAARPWLASVPPIPLRHRLSGHIARITIKLSHIISRAIPEVIIAFIALSMFGGKLWPAVLALAIHNYGILGRLGAETIDNYPRGLPAAFRATGMRRMQIFGMVIFPSIFPRLLVYFFYRWETCLRETTALGILGCATLGYHIRLVNARLRYDEMLVLVLIGAGIVILGDLCSTLVRRWVRRAL